MPLGGLVVAGIGSAIGIGKGIADLSRAKKIKPQYNPFEISESAKRMQGLAQAQLNARAPGAAARERSIQGSQAQTLGAVGRGARDSASALQMAAVAQAQAGREQAQMQDMDAQYYQSALGRLFGAEQNMQQQEAMKYQEDFRKYQMDTQMKEALRSEGFQGIVGGLQNAGGMMMAAGSGPNAFLGKTGGGQGQPSLMSQGAQMFGVTPDQASFRSPIAGNDSYVNPSLGFAAINNTRTPSGFPMQNMQNQPPGYTNYFQQRYR
jgi:hypothetical protein